jgi:hypothetical protein
MHITYSECVCVALVIQHTQRKRRNVLLSAACLVVAYFYTLSYKRYDFRKKKLLNIKFYFDSLYKFYLKYFSLYEEFSEILP